METVDSCGLLPMRAAGQVFPTAYAFRRFLQKVLPKHLMDLPKRDPLKNIRLSPVGGIPNTIGKKWPKASISELVDQKTVSGIILDHGVSVVPLQGGSSIEAALSLADSACYAAKEKGRTRIDIYHPDDDPLATTRSADLHWASSVTAASRRLLSRIMSRVHSNSFPAS